MTVLHPGTNQGPVLLLDEPLSFWGAFDPRSGLIIDIHHPQKGQNLKGKILMMLESRGSGSAPGGLAEAIRLGTAPAGIILVQPGGVTESMGTDEYVAKFKPLLDQNGVF